MLSSPDPRDRTVTSPSAARYGNSPPIFDFLYVKIEAPKILEDDDETTIADSHVSAGTRAASSVVAKSLKFATSSVNNINVSSKWALRWVKMHDNIVFIFKNELELNNEVVNMFTLQPNSDIITIFESPAAYGFSITLPRNRGKIYFSTDEQQTVELWMMTMIIRR